MFGYMTHEVPKNCMAKLNFFETVTLMTYFLNGKTKNFAP